MSSKTRSVPVLPPFGAVRVLLADAIILTGRHRRYRDLAAEFSRLNDQRDIAARRRVGGDLSKAASVLAAKNGASLDEKSLLQFVREKLADYKVPRGVVFMAALPVESA